MPVWERKHLQIGSGCATAVAGACWCTCFDKVCAAQTHCQRLFITSSYESISVYGDDCAGGGECYKYFRYCKRKLPPEGVGKRVSVLKKC